MRWIKMFLWKCEMTKTHKKSAPNECRCLPLIRQRANTNIRLMSCCALDEKQRNSLSLFRWRWMKMKMPKQGVANWQINLHLSPNEFAALWNHKDERARSIQQQPNVSHRSELIGIQLGWHADATISIYNRKQVAGMNSSYRNQTPKIMPKTTRNKSIASQAKMKCHQHWKQQQNYINFDYLLGELSVY